MENFIYQLFRHDFGIRSALRSMGDTVLLLPWDWSQYKHVPSSHHCAVWGKK